MCSVGYTKRINQELEPLIQEAKQRVSEHSTAEQVIVVKTVKGNVHFFANNVSDQKYEEEKEFVQKLIEEDDAVIDCIVCMWDDFNLDLPSMNFRKLLLAANEENNHAKICLGDGTRMRTIQKCMPSPL